MNTSTFLADDIPAECEEVIRRFEDAWQGPGRPDVESYLPTPRTGHTRLLFELIHIDLDLRLRNGESVRVEHYLERFPDLEQDRDALLELIASEYALRRNWRGVEDANGYLTRFPQYAEELRARLAATSDLSTTPRSRTFVIPGAQPEIPGYHIYGELGRGGMGVVYEAHQIAANRSVALKTLLPGYVSSGVFDRFRREAEAIARLDHANIVPVYEVGEASGLPYFSMKFYPGGNLADRIHGPSADPRGDARLLETIARAVHHAHERGVLHRDLKPSNILLDDAARPHITDFGLAKQFDPSDAATLNTAVVGTPSYIAPEQARGDRAVTTATDVYGLGAVLYELLTGSPPFLAETPLATLAEVVERLPRRPRQLNPSVPADLETICLKCLEKEPARRYPSAAALADDLERWRTGEPISVRPVGRLEGVVRWARRKPREAAIAALVAAVVVLIVGGAWALDRRQAQHQIEQEFLRSQAQERVRGALAQMPSMHQQFLWKEGAVVLERAQQEVDVFGLEDIRADVLRAQRELTLAARLDAILLDRVTTHDQVARGRPAAARSYHEAFREYGLDLEGGDQDEIVRQVKASASREELTAALNWCARYDGKKNERLRTIAKAAEKDEWKALLTGIPTGLTIEQTQAHLQQRVAVLGPDQLTPWLMARVGKLLEGTDEGLDLLRTAQRQMPADFWANFSLGNTLSKSGRQEEAIGYLMVARGVRPNRGVVHHNLGVCLNKAGRPNDALASHREAARLDPGKPAFLLGCAIALLGKGLLDEAIPGFEATLRLDPDHAPAHCNYGFALMKAGRFADAIRSLRRGRELATRDTPAPASSANWLEDAQHMQELEDRLPSVLAGLEAPGDANERLGFARMCRYKGRHALAVEIYVEALAAGGRGPTGRQVTERTDAASSAIRAAGRAAEADRPALRRQALDWLKADFTELERRVEKDGKKARPALELTLRLWQHIADLAGVREKTELARLPGDEAKDWKDFWKRVAEQLAR